MSSDDFMAQFASSTTREIAANKQRELQNKNLVALVGIINNQTKEITQLVELTKKQNESSRRTSQVSFGISILAVLLAGLSAVFSFLDYIGDSSWQKDQIGVLNEIKSTVSLEEIMEKPYPEFEILGNETISP